MKRVYTLSNLCLSNNSFVISAFFTFTSNPLPPDGISRCHSLFVAYKGVERCLFHPNPWRHHQVDHLR